MSAMPRHGYRSLWEERRFIFVRLVISPRLRRAPLLLIVVPGIATPPGASIFWAKSASFHVGAMVAPARKPMAGFAALGSKARAAAIPSVGHGLGDSHNESWRAA